VTPEVYAILPDAIEKKVFPTSVANIGKHLMYDSNVAMQPSKIFGYPSWQVNPKKNIGGLAASDNLFLNF